MLGDTMVVVPNSKLAGSVITNFSLPKTELGFAVDVGVDYASDLEKVEAITREVARQVMNRVDGAAPEFEPHMHFHSFADSSINFKIWLGARNYVASLKVKHEFIKCLHSRYKQEGIVIPSPIRTIDVPETLLRKLRECFHARSCDFKQQFQWTASA